MTRFILTAILGLAVSRDVAAAEPPPGFVSLWNGRDLAGFHYMDTFDIRKYPYQTP